MCGFESQSSRTVAAISKAVFKACMLLIYTRYECIRGSFKASSCLRPVAKNWTTASAMLSIASLRSVLGRLSNQLQYSIIGGWRRDYYGVYLPNVLMTAFSLRPIEKSMLLRVDVSSMSMIPASSSGSSYGIEGKKFPARSQRLRSLSKTKRLS